MTRKHLAIALASLITFCGVAAAEEIDPKQQCDALGDVFTNYSSKKTDPDMDKATALFQDGAGDCRDGRYEDGINKMNNAMGMVHDGRDSGRDGRR